MSRSPPSSISSGDEVGELAVRELDPGELAVRELDAGDVLALCLIVAPLGELALGELTVAELAVRAPAHTFFNDAPLDTSWPSLRLALWGNGGASGRPPPPSSTPPRAGAGREVAVGARAPSTVTAT